MNTIGARLTLALQRKGLSVRAFHRALEDREGGKILGTSYANIRRYLSGADPNPSFLDAAADELGVRVEWLTFNSGPAEDPQPAGARAVFDEEMGKVFPPYLLSRTTVKDGLASVWWETVQRRAELSAGRRVTPLEVSEVAKGDVGRDVAERIGKSIRWPLYATDGSAIDLNEPIARDAYLLALTQALTIASQTFMRAITRMLSDPTLRRAAEEGEDVDPKTEEEV